MDYQFPKHFGTHYNVAAWFQTHVERDYTVDVRLPKHFGTDYTVGAGHYNPFGQTIQWLSGFTNKI